MYKNVLFDWDGCLVNSLEAWVASCRRGLALHGVELSHQEVWRHFQAGTIPHGLPVRDTEACAKDIARVATQELAQAPLFDGVEQLLRCIGRTAQLALVTNTPRDALAQHAGFLNIEHLFTAVIAGDDVARPKPHPEGIYRALAIMDTASHDGVLVGDADIDAQAAASAGVDFILMRHNNTRHLSFKIAQPTRIACTFTELQSIIA